MNDDNPRLQCELCGKWRRLWDSQDNQLMFPFVVEDDPKHYYWLPDDIYYDTLCVWCHLLFGVVCPPFEEVVS